jgi:hypothetical protein
MAKLLRFCALTLAACSNPPMATAQHGASSPSTAQAATEALGSVGCLGQPETRVTYDVTCQSASDCSIAWALLDCCGTAHAVGVSEAAEPKLKQQLVPCQANGVCECLAQPTLTDSGERVEQAAEVVVSCAQGRCRTHALVR